MAGIGIVVAILVTLVAVLIPWLPTSASKQMDRIEFVYWFATVICIAIFALVMAVLIYSVITFRSPPEDESDGPSIHGHTGLEIVWTVVPAILVIAIGVLSAVVLSQNGNAGTNPMTIKVFAQQFAWRFEYPDDEGPQVRRARPAGRPQHHVRDAVGGRDPLVLDPGHGAEAGPRAGNRDEHRDHADADGDVLAHLHRALRSRSRDDAGAGAAFVSQADFAAWVKEQQAGGSARGDTGAAVFASAGCGGCHAFTPAGTNGAVGPNLDNVAADAQKAGEDPAAYVKESIVDPNKVIAPGYAAGVMPGTFGDVALRRGDRRPRHVSDGGTK